MSKKPGRPTVNGKPADRLLVAYSSESRIFVHKLSVTGPAMYPQTVLVGSVRSTIAILPSGTACEQAEAIGKQE